ncbi:hypothetical protein [Streptomyces sp. NPDC019507]|uniref:hypothetical protein n=1 Tax=Streptomyces sp. NPDC019507 TaxID=3154689 RepID=UPI0033CC6065
MHGSGTTSTGRNGGTPTHRAAARTPGADPLHLELVLGIDEKTAIRYAESARVLLGAAAERSSQ